ncbi:MAG: epimerase, partial [Saprospiraceae bacterium]|nr:epimerase [Saprospiraceae bacterium]
MKVIITGATGMVGKGVLLECLDHPEIELVLTLGRHPVDVTHPKLNQITVNDFGNFQSIVKDLGEYDACFYCMGVSAGGLDETAYTRLTYDYTMALAELLYSLHRDMTFIYVSGEGTDASEKGRMMWARVKGKTENDLMKLGFKQVFAFRPGIIIPLRGIKSRTKSYQFMYDYFMWLVKIIKAITPKSVVNTTQIGK